jgi:hypothetical protein
MRRFSLLVLTALVALVPLMYAQMPNSASAPASSAPAPEVLPGHGADQPCLTNLSEPRVLSIRGLVPSHPRGFS